MPSTTTPASSFFRCRVLKNSTAPHINCFLIWHVRSLAIWLLQEVSGGSGWHVLGMQKQGSSWRHGRRIDSMYRFILISPSLAVGLACHPQEEQLYMVTWGVAYDNPLSLAYTARILVSAVPLHDYYDGSSGCLKVGQAGPHYHLPKKKMGLYSTVILLCLAALTWSSSVLATPLSERSLLQPVYLRFTSKNNPELALRFVENSGVCETTPGVRQISGYIDVGTNMSMVSFEQGLCSHSSDRLIIVVLVLRVPTRTRHSTDYSLVCVRLVSCHFPSANNFINRLHGGPGCSSMIGLFQENGPCRVNPDRLTTTINPFRYIVFIHCSRKP